MRKIIIILLGILSLCNTSSAQEEAKWNIAKSTHFVIYYKNAQEEFITRLMDKSEDYYENIASDLGFSRFNFWLWENRAKIYIYDNSSEYQAATGQPSWSGGCVRVVDKTISSFPYANGFFETILPHELGHIIFREFVGFGNPGVPLWLDEGVASYQEKSRYVEANKQLKEAIKLGNLPASGQLSAFTLNPSMQNGLVQLLYSKAFSIVDFLIKEYGREQFVSFCRNLRDAKSLERALALTYPIKNSEELELAWQQYLNNS